MKNAYCFIILAMIICNVSCANKKEIKVSKETVKVLFEEEEQDIALWTMYEKENNLYLAVLSQKDTLIHILKEEKRGFVPICKFALDTATIRQLLTEDNMLLQSAMLMTDSNMLLLIANNYMYTLCDINKQKVVFQRIQYNDSIRIASSINDAILYDMQQKKLLYFPAYNNGDTDRYNILAGENIYTGEKKMYPIYFPHVKEFKDGYSYLDLYNLYCIAGSKYVTTQSKTTCITVYDTLTCRIKTYNIIPDHYTPYPKEYKKLNLNNNFIGLINLKNKSMTCDYYNHALLYDKYNRLYYRFFSLAQPEYNEEGLKNTINTKRTGVSLIDENFNYIGDYVENSLLFITGRHAVPTSGGLAFLVSEHCKNGICGLKKGKYEVVKISFDY